MIKYRLYYDKDAETHWLNAMAREGWALRKFFAGFYWFEPCEKGEYVYQIDFLDRPGAVTDEYRALIEDTGAQIIQTWFFWVLLRRPASMGEFTLYTDATSAIEHYSKIRTMLKIAAIIEIVCTIIELFAAIMGFQAGYAFACLAAAFAVLITHAAQHTTDIINRLKEGQGLAAPREKRPYSPLLPCGLLLNSIVLIISPQPPLLYCLSAIAFLLIAAGIFQILKGRMRR